MNYFNKSSREFSALQSKYGTKSSKTSNAGLGAADWAGMGLQLYGASLQDKSAQEELERQKEAERLAMIIRSREGRASAQQSEIQNQQQDRSQNMAAFQMLSNMRQQAMQNGRTYSMRKDFLKAIG